MSSPTQSTWTKRSFHGSSQYVAAENVQDTAMSVASVPATPENVAVETATSVSGMHVMSGSTAMVSSKSFNAKFQKIQS